MRKSLRDRLFIEIVVWSVVALLFAKEGLCGGWGIGGGAGVAIPGGGLGRDLRAGPRLEIAGGKEIRSGLRIQGGLRSNTLHGKREGVMVNFLSAGISSHFKTSRSRDKISLLISGGLGWDWIDRSFKSGKERGSGPFLSGEGGVNLPFGSTKGNLDLEGLIIIHRTLSQKSGNIVSFGLRIWYNFNEK